MHLKHKRNNKGLGVFWSLYSNVQALFLPDHPTFVFMELSQQPSAEETDAMRRNRSFNRVALVVIFLMILIVGVLFIKRKKPAEAVGFSANFHPPTSLLADFRNRYPSQIDREASGACLRALEEADAFYTSGDLEAARDALLVLAIEEHEACSADAWFYLGITSIAMREPGTALECLAKIDNLDDFGEDIYWYQALAFVQISEKKTSIKPRAIGALRRFVDTSRDSARVHQAVELLNALETQ
jgi:tetratricopeptide (TPR) repeat protein